MIELPIYDSGKNKPQTFQFVILGASVIFIYYLFPSIQSIGILIIILVVALYLMLTEKKKIQTGKIYLTNHQIKIIIETNEFQIDLANIDRLELIYTGYKGKRIPGDIIPRFNTFSGKDNFIKLNNDNNEYNYKFFVENELQEKDIIELVRNWGESGYNTSNIKINQ